MIFLIKIGLDFKKEFLPNRFLKRTGGLMSLINLNFNLKKSFMLIFIKY